MRSVLGIDAAWTTKNPSGVALVSETGTGWKLSCVESSYQRFQCEDSERVQFRSGAARGSKIDAVAVLDKCKQLHFSGVDLIAVDMPLSSKPIIGRRFADDAISKKYGGRRKASTHSPSTERPGIVSVELVAAFGSAGYGLCTEVVKLPGLIEVYPHPALIELTGSAERLMYKHGRSKKYWPNLEKGERNAKLLAVWSMIVEYLEREIVGITDLLPLPDTSASGTEMKSYEDKLDAVVCAWVGVCVITGRGVAYGNAQAAIWCPHPNVRSTLDDV